MTTSPNKMTNYNERLDEIERHFRAAWKQNLLKALEEK